MIMRENNLRIKIIVILVAFALLWMPPLSAGNETCDTECQRILDFLSTQMNPITNQLGAALNISIPISGPLNRQMRLYNMLTALYSVLFGLTDEKLIEPLNESLDLTLQIEQLRTNLETVYKSLTQKSVPLLFSSYAWHPVNSKNIKSAEITFDNQTSMPWTVNLLPSNTYASIRTGKSSLTIDQPLFRIYLNGQQKKANKNLGTWFLMQQSYPNELYAIKNENNVFILQDISTGKKITAQKPILAQTINTL